MKEHGRGKEGRRDNGKTRQRLRGGEDGGPYTHTAYGLLV